MKKKFVIFLICMVCFVSNAFLETQANPAPPPPDKHNNRPHNNHHHNESCPRVLKYVESFDEVTAFPRCKEHFLVTFTDISHYSDGTTSTSYRYRILDWNRKILADNLSHVTHCINSQGRHYFVVKSLNNNKRKYVIMDSRGNVSQTTGYSKYSILGKDYLIVQQDRKYGIVDFHNNVILDIKYKSIEEYNNFLLTKFNGYYGLADKSGNIVLNNNYDKISKKGNLFILKYQDKYGIADSFGKILYTPSFDSIKQDGDYFKVKSNGKYGIIDIDGKLIYPIKYKKVRIERNIPQVYENNQWL